MNDTDQEVYRAPDRSRATRTPPARSRRSSRGLITARLPNDELPRHFWFESKLEQKVFYLLAARPDTHDLQEQSAPISYVDWRGRQRSHYPDFLLTKKCGARSAIAVKSSRLVERTGLREELSIIRAAMPLSYAKHLVLITERSFAPSDARNAERLHEFRRHPDPEADERIAELLKTLTAETTVASIVEASGLGGRGFRAVFRAIFAKLATPVGKVDILPATIIRPGMLS